MRLLVFMVMQGAATIVGSLAARADYTLCNKTASTVYVALGGEKGAGSGNWISAGWYGLKSGECRIYSHNTYPTGKYYYYAFSVLGRELKHHEVSGRLSGLDIAGSYDSIEYRGIIWDGTSKNRGTESARSFCVHSGQMFENGSVLSSDKTHCDAGWMAEVFSETPSDGHGNFATTFSSPASIFVMNIPLVAHKPIIPPVSTLSPETKPADLLPNRPGPIVPQWRQGGAPTTTPSCCKDNPFESNPGQDLPTYEDLNPDTRPAEPTTSVPTQPLEPLILD